MLVLHKSSASLWSLSISLANFLISGWSSIRYSISVLSGNTALTIPSSEREVSVVVPGLKSRQ
jgi:hypothetical protein